MEAEPLGPEVTVKAKEIEARPWEAGGARGRSPSEEGSLDRFAVTLGEMGRLWRSYQDRVLRCAGLSLVQWQVIHHLSRKREPLVQRRLALAIGVEEPVLVRVLDRLERAGLVERRPSQADRRAKTVHLTARAGPVLAAAEVELHEMREALLRDFAPEELERSARMFSTVADRLWELSAKSGSRVSAEKEPKSPRGDHR